MLTYTLKKEPGLPLYEALYRCIRQDILTGALPAGTKLPSKRALAQNLEVSKITVEGAYGQLLAEGYIRSREKVGYFVEQVEQPAPLTAALQENAVQPEELPGGNNRFPFSVWSRLQRQVMLDVAERLLQPLPNQGLLELRRAIALQLAQFRGMQVKPENILIGAGTDFLYNLLIQLLGRDKCYCVEEPGYSKIRLIYKAGGVRCVGAAMDEQGVIPESLSGAQILHISPSHHFPTGIITPPERRQALLHWAAQAQDRYIIEDDYDSEFRFNARPMPAMYSMDSSGSVIYMNTFTKTLATTIRISYMILPDRLRERFQQELGFYSCTVPSFEQYTLARFLEQGYFEKHLNRLRKFYKARRDRVMGALEGQKLTILEENAGLHFLLKVQTQLSDAELNSRCEDLPVRTLSSYYHDPATVGNTGCLVVNYSNLTDGQLSRLLLILSQL